MNFFKKLGVVSAIGISTLSFAVDTTWTATLTNDMTDTTNWDNGVPDGTNNAIFDSSIICRQSL